MESRKLLTLALSLMVAAIVLLVSVLAYAQATALNPDTNMAELIKFLVQSFQAGNWFVVGGIIIMLIVWGIGNFLPNSKFLPLISAGVGMLGGLVTGFVDGKNPWYVSMYMGLLEGSAASHFWSLFGKFISPMVDKIVKKNLSVETEKEVDKTPPIV